MHQQHPQQYAVGVAVALEKLSATMSVLLLQHPEAAVIQIDVVSTFNHMLPEVMLEEIEPAARNCSPPSPFGSPESELSSRLLSTAG